MKRRDLAKEAELVEAFERYVSRFEYHLMLAPYLQMKPASKIAALVRIGFMGDKESDSSRINRSYIRTTTVARQVMDIVRWMRDKEGVPEIQEARKMVQEARAKLLTAEYELRRRDEEVQTLRMHQDTLIRALGRVMAR